MELSSDQKNLVLFTQRAPRYTLASTPSAPALLCFSSPSPSVMRASGQLMATPTPDKVAFVVRASCWLCPSPRVNTDGRLFAQQRRNVLLEGEELEQHLEAKRIEGSALLASCRLQSCRLALPHLCAFVLVFACMRSEQKELELKRDLEEDSDDDEDAEMEPETGGAGGFGLGGSGSAGAAGASGGFSAGRRMKKPSAPFLM